MAVPNSAKAAPPTQVPIPPPRRGPQRSTALPNTGARMIADSAKIEKPEEISARVQPNSRSRGCMNAPREPSAMLAMLMPTAEAKANFQ